MYYRKAETFPSMLEIKDNNLPAIKLSAPKVKYPNRVHFVVAALMTEN